MKGNSTTQRFHPNVSTKQAACFVDIGVEEKPELNQLNPNFLWLEKDCHPLFHMAIWIYMLGVCCYIGWLTQLLLIHVK
jgi:hypothetical protein